MGEFTGVDVPRLTAMGDAVREVAGRLDRLGAGLEAATHQADGAIEGSRTCEWGLPDVTRNWHGNLERLAADVREFAEELHRTAADYKRSDLDAYGRIRSTGTGF
ncbi:hypothetical protein ACFQS1_37385 [Paractinoplanes rhizophilus]|jgi:hypothetical protein|uniref:Excreted virulence factor EspC (Type VII ESX diderm) n=1 Tax=Paractinoplanes rhizophilus TaxID=1416877 RepID=A0ABW2I446_9ACTN|nr:hypothetical protein [Actinoplanes sp.]